MKILTYQSMKMRVVLVFCCIATFSLKAQQSVTDQVNSMMPKPVPPTPNTASLGKFGDYQVGFYTGLPEISIELYSAKSGELTIPITLSYHASGIKPTDVASWVGSGWALSAGGQVSRSIAGKPDEEGFLSAALQPNPSTCNSYYYLEHAARGATDVEPDIFSYSFPGKSGKYLMQYGASPFLIPFAPIVVNPGGTTISITDENGVSYRFGTNSSNVNYTESTTVTNGGNPSYSANTSWLLTEMVAPNSDDRIDLRYQTVGTSTTHDVSYSYALTDQCYEDNLVEVDGVPQHICPGNEFLVKSMNNDSYSTQKGVQYISFENGKLEFILGQNRLDQTGLKSLDRINVYSTANGTQVLLKTFKFNYSYFTNSTGQNAILKLDAVDIQDPTGLRVERYGFTYSTNALSWNQSHSNFLNARDLWGYYNGALQNTDLLLPKTVSFQELSSTLPYNISFGGAADRTVHENFAKEGVLTRIDFPTGGYSIFDYESNRYLNGNTSTLAGGLRVKKIATYDGTSSAPVVKTYRYGENESGYGVPNFNDLQFNYSSSGLFSQLGCSAEMPHAEYRIRTWYSNSAFSIDSYDSSPIHYNYVTEYVGDYSGTTNGKIVYEFDNGSSASDFDYVVPISNKYYRSSNFWKRGKLTKKSTFDNANNLLSRQLITYSTYQVTNEKYIGVGVFTYVTGWVNGCGAQQTCINEINETVDSRTYQAAKFYQSSGAFVETETQEYAYEPGNISEFVLSRNSKTYDNQKVQLLTTTVNSSTSIDQTVTVNTYPFQLSANASSSGAAKGIHLLNNKNIVATPVETFTFLQSPQGTNQRVIGGTVRTYKENEANTSQVVADQIFIFQPLNPLARNSYAPISINGTNSGIIMNSNYKPEITFSKYDTYGNLTSLYKSNNITVGYLYGYGGSLPIAEVINTQPKNVFYTSFEDASSNTINEGKTGLKSKGLSAAYTKSLTGLDPGNYTLSYFQKVSNSWQLQESIVAVSSTGTYTITIPSTTQVDELRFFPKDTRLKTYTYIPLVGLGSIADENNRCSYFSYDAFGRLSLVKDDAGKIVKNLAYHYKR
jgi:hypothetical protein